MSEDISCMSRDELLAHRDYLISRLNYNKETLNKCIRMSLSPAERTDLFDPISDETRSDILISFRNRISRYEKDIS